MLAPEASHVCEGATFEDQAICLTDQFGFALHEGAIEVVAVGASRPVRLALPCALLVGSYLALSELLYLMPCDARENLRRQSTRRCR